MNEPTYTGPMRFDTKIAIMIRDDLETWQRLNATAFLASGVAASGPDVIGEPYADADGTAYHALFRQPVMVFEGSKENLTGAHQRALARGFEVAVFTSDMFVTGHDEANRAVVRAVGRDDLDLVGIALHGPKNAVDKWSRAHICIREVVESRPGLTGARPARPGSSWTQLPG